MKLNALALAVAGVMFLLYPVVRPWEDETTAAGMAAALGSGAWVASHLFAMIGFILVPLGLLAVSKPAAIVYWIGAGLTLPYYGAEDFALNAVARHVSGQPLLDVVESFRYGPVAVTSFAAGLLLIAVGAVMAAVKERSAWLFAAGFVLFLPQFFTPPAFRIAHGVLVAAGTIWLAVTVWRDTVR